MNAPTAILSGREPFLRLTLGAFGTALTAAILSVSVLHWGGVYPAIGTWLQMAGGALWAVVAAICALNFTQRKASGDPIDLAVFLFLAYAGWRYTTTPVEYPARLEWLWILTYAAIFLFVRYGMPNRHWAMALIGLLVAVALASCIYALINRNNPTHLIWGLPRPNYQERVSGTFGCPNHFANLMVMAALCCLFIGSYSRLPWPLRIFLYYLAALLTTGLYFSISRGGYLAWVTGMGVVAWFLFRKAEIRWWWKLTAAITVAAGAVVVVIKNPFVMERIDGMVRGDIRQLLAEVSLHIWQMAPWWGHGVGGYDFLYLRHHGLVLQTRALYAHCDYFNTLVDYGAVGLGLILVFLTCVIVELRRKSRTGTHERDLLLVRLGWAALAAMAIHSVFDFSLHIPACAVAFFIILAAAVMRTHHEEKHLPSVRLPRLALVLAALAALAASGYTTATAWQTGRALRLVPTKEKDFTPLADADLRRLGEQLYALDPNAYPQLERIGDAYRVRAAKLGSELSQSPGSLELLRAREDLGKRSLMYYQRAHQAAPLEDTLLVKQAMILDILQRSAEAELAFQKAISLQPHNRYFRFHYGLHLLESGDIGAALDQFRFSASMPLDPREDPALRQFALMTIQKLEKSLRR
ncbi:MAG: O-antigen ligase family protein [Candidatus Methylacidiphilales bacterium]|nr:O-antigen ligase family protein [Candidatus Methylacidiphilales bacterium]